MLGFRNTFEGDKPDSFSGLSDNYMLNKPDFVRGINKLANILKKTMNRSIISIFILILSSCGNKETKKNEEARSMNDPGVPIHVLIDSVENYGSVYAFDLLETASLDYRPGDFLSTFMIMADKYNNAFAAMTVYYQLVWMYNIPLIDESENGIYALYSLNNDTKKMAIRYLIKADSLGNEEARKHLEEYKQNGIIK